MSKRAVASVVALILGCGIFLLGGVSLTRGVAHIFAARTASGNGPAPGGRKTVVHIIVLRSCAGISQLCRRITPSSGPCGPLEFCARADSTLNTSIIRSPHSNFAPARVIDATSCTNPGRLPVCSCPCVFSWDTEGQ